MRKSVAAAALAIAGLLLALVYHRALGERGIDRHQRLVRAGQPQQRQGPGRVQPRHHRRRPDHPVDPQRRQPAAVAVRRLRRRLLPAQVAASGKVLDVSSRSTADGAAIVQWTDGNGTNQQLRLADSADGYVRLINRNSGKALEVQGASTADGGNIVQYADWGGTNQQWQLVRVGGTDPTHATRRRRHVHQPGGLAGLRRRRHHPGRRRLLLLGLDDALLAGRADPALLRPGELGVRRPLGAQARLRLQRLRPQRRPRVRQGHLGVGAQLPPEQQHLLLDRLHRVQPHLRLHRHRGRRHLDQKRSQINNCYYDAGLLVDDNDTMYVAYGNSTISVAQLSADGLSQVRTQQVFTDAVERRHPGGRPVLQAQRQLLHLADPPGQRPVRAASRAARSARTRCGRCCSTCPARSPAAACRTRAAWCRPRTATGTTWPSSTPTPAAGARLAPITWTADGWPVAADRQRRAGAPRTRSRTSPRPRTVAADDRRRTPSPARTLGPQWEWNHNPDTSRSSASATGCGCRPPPSPTTSTTPATP